MRNDARLTGPGTSADASIGRHRAHPAPSTYPRRKWLADLGGTLSDYLTRTVCVLGVLAVIGAASTGSTQDEATPVPGTTVATAPAHPHGGQPAPAPGATSTQRRH